MTRRAAETGRWVRGFGKTDEYTGPESLFRDRDPEQGAGSGAVGSAETGKCTEPESLFAIGTRSRAQAVGRCPP